MATKLRPSGIPVVGTMPWGTHFCHFYETKQDLLDILIPYFQTGLEHNEFCMWVIFDPLNQAEATDALRAVIPMIDHYIAAGQIAIIPHTQWYLRDSSFDLQQVLSGWQEKLAQALAGGYDGMRVNGNEAWLTKEDWGGFSKYEDYLNVLIANQRMIVLCAYPLAVSGAVEIFDVARTHQFAIARRNGHWEMLETPELMHTKAEVSRLNEQLEQRIAKRTGELAATNQALRQEIAERKRAEAERTRLFAQVHASHEQLQILSRQLLLAQEAERHALARELHDEIGQQLTALSLMLAITPQLPPDLAQARLAEAEALVRNLIEQVRNLALDLRPAMLDDLGLVPALVWMFERYSMQTHVAVQFEQHDMHEQRFAPGVETTAYRIVQEALTNVARHAGVTEVIVRLWTDGDMLSMVIADQGSGFDPQAVRTARSIGLTGMAERATLLGGELTIESAAGVGTRVTAVVPCTSGGESPTQEHTT